MREPSIHIKEKDLIKILEELLPSKIDKKELAIAIAKKASKLSPNNRLVNITNDRIEKKVKNILKSSKKDTLLLSDLIHKKRIQLKHRGISMIGPDDKEWGQLKELTQVCIDFCEEVNIENKREGFLKYIDIGFSYISSTRQYIGKLINLKERITEDYYLVKDIENDDNSSETKEIHDYYCSMIYTRTGINNNYTKIPGKYIHFVKVRELTDKLNIPFNIYIDAQFKGLAWADSFPEPNQLVGDKANERLSKYMYENKIRVNDKKDKKEKAINVLLKIKNDRNRSK